MEILLPRVTQIADWGTEEPWVARIEISLTSFIKNLDRDKDILDKMNDSIFYIGNELSGAFLSLRRVKKRDLLKLEEDKEYKNLYNQLWTAYKDRLQTFMSLFGYDVGFIYRKDAEFKQGINKYFSVNKFRGNFKESIINDRYNWQNSLSRIRNDFNQHQKLHSDDVLKYFNPNIAQIMFDNVWQAIEDIIIAHIDFDLSKSKSHMQIYNIEEDRINKSMPEKYEIGLTSEILATLNKHIESSGHK